VEPLAAKLGIQALAVFRSELSRRSNLIFTLRKMHDESDGCLMLQRIIQESEVEIGKTVVFVQSRKASETIGDWLREHVCPSFVSYHAGVADRSACFSDFMKSGKMVATTCAGTNIHQLSHTHVGGYFPFSYLENGLIKIAWSLGVRAAGGKPKWSL
jgi:superfamily II DNA helicase RecQ